jgi:hypothetical protein
MGIVSITAGSKEPDVQFLSVRVVDYHDQVEMGSPRTAFLEPLVGKEAAEHAPTEILPKGPVERPHRALLRVGFRSAKDLWALAQRNATLFLHSSFCNRKDSESLGGPGVYSRGHAVQLSEAANSALKERDGEYYFYLNVAGKESPQSVPPRVGFDLRSNPEDICFYVTGWVGGLIPRTIYQSAVASVPKAAIAAAFRESLTPGSNSPE